jgi:hypothetical protein
MNTDHKTARGEQMPTQSMPCKHEAGEHEAVTTSSGIRFSLPSWAEKDSPVNRSPDPEQAGPETRFDAEYF